MATYHQTADHEIKPDHEIRDTEGHETVPMEKARGAETTGHMRIVLGISFALAVICLGIVMLAFAGGI
jgi:hypothetical protein